MEKTLLGAPPRMGPAMSDPDLVGAPMWAPDTAIKNVYSTLRLQKEVNKTLWEYKHIARIQDFGEETTLKEVCRIRDKKSCISSTLQDSYHLSSSRVHVKWSNMLWFQVSTNKSNTKSVKSRHVVYIHSL
ncbi:hypothetical protein H5410_012827 [Solanum commersonii]|uniref:Uncharacterized protein n=1 Tax=Solanum commersonii TaxID=4109 RepID=A0A9J6ATF7_SOLCO|nr:hypothetical protein H5410_012827 [Solanum commersonii]